MHINREMVKYQICRNSDIMCIAVIRTFLRLFWIWGSYLGFQPSPNDNPKNFRACLLNHKTIRLTPLVKLQTWFLNMDIVAQILFTVYLKLLGLNYIWLFFINWKDKNYWKMHNKKTSYSLQDKKRWTHTQKKNTVPETIKLYYIVLQGTDGQMDKVSALRDTFLIWHQYWLVPGSGLKSD